MQRGTSNSMIDTTGSASSGGKRAAPRATSAAMTTTGTAALPEVRRQDQAADAERHRHQAVRERVGGLRQAALEPRERVAVGVSPRAPAEEERPVDARARERVEVLAHPVRVEVRDRHLRLLR